MAKGFIELKTKGHCWVCWHHHVARRASVMECPRQQQPGSSTQPRRGQSTQTLWTGTEIRHPKGKARAPSPPGLHGRQLKTSTKVLIPHRFLMILRNKHKLKFQILFCLVVPKPAHFLWTTVITNSSKMSLKWIWTHFAGIGNDLAPRLTCQSWDLSKHVV